MFIAHDLDADNRRLLRDGRISVVLHNDLRADARLAMRLILQERGALPAEPVAAGARSRSSRRTTCPAEPHFVNDQSESLSLPDSLPALLGVTYTVP